MIKKLGKIFITLLIVLCILVGISALNTCTPHPAESKTNQMSFGSDIFYFNRYVKYKDIDDGRSIYASQYESGSIQVYGNVVIVNKTDEKRTYFITKEEYDEDEQIYTFYAKNVTITFDVNERTFDVHYDGNGGGDVFHINSTIKSNW